MSSIFPITVDKQNLRDVSLGRYLGCLSILIFGPLSFAEAVQSVTLAWNPSASADVVGYKIYYGTSSGSAQQALDVGNVTTATVSNLDEASTYFFAVTAYNNAGLESQRSNEVSYATLTTPSELYSLTVNNGSGDGRYPSGTSVTVSADPPGAGQTFAIWTGDTAILDNFTSATTQAFLPPSDVTITATYSAVAGGNAQNPPINLPATPATGSGTGLQGQYYNDSSSAGYPLDNPFTSAPALTRTDSSINFSWGLNSPAPSVNADNFSVKWTGTLKAPVTGVFTFILTGDDGVRLFLDGSKVIDGWNEQFTTAYTYSVLLTAGQLYTIELHYFERGHRAACYLSWTYPGQAEQTIPQNHLYPPGN
jgi:hypothetical protein